MKNVAQDLMLKLLFGSGGIAVVVIAWLRPMPVPEIIISHLIGLSGLGGVLRWSFLSKSSPLSGAEETVPANVDVKNWFRVKFTWC